MRSLWSQAWGCCKLLSLPPGCFSCTSPMVVHAEALRAVPAPMEITQYSKLGYGYSQCPATCVCLSVRPGEISTTKLQGRWRKGYQDSSPKPCLPAMVCLGFLCGGSHLSYLHCPPGTAPTPGYSCKQTQFFLSFKLLMSVLAKVATKTLLPWLVALENVGCSELIQIKGRLEVRSGDHRDSLHTTIKPSTSPAIGTGWGWKRLGNLEWHLQNRMQWPRIFFKAQNLQCRVFHRHQPHWKWLQDMPCWPWYLPDPKHGARGLMTPLSTFQSVPT